jgi:uncharacterized membrane protein
MSTVHLHLLLNHFPIVGSIFASAILVLAVARKSSELAKLAFGAFAVLGILSILVYLTGGSAEEAVERLPGISEAVIERHEEAALAATIAIGVIGALSAVLLLWYRRRILPRLAVSAMLVGAMGVAGLMAYAANLGGQIRHTEIRSGAVATTSSDRDGERRDAEREHR